MQATFAEVKKSNTGSGQLQLSVVLTGSEKLTHLLMKVTIKFSCDMPSLRSPLSTPMAANQCLGWASALPSCDLSSHLFALRQTTIC